MCVQLPSQSEILARLNTLEATSHVEHGLHPIIAKNGGDQFLVAIGVILVLIHSVDEYFQNSGLPESGKGLFIQWIPKYIDALVDDPACRTEAKAIFEEALRRR